MQFNVKGTVLPVLEVTLAAQESFISTHGELGWMTTNVQVSQGTGTASGKGFMKSVKRVAGGGGLFITHYEALSDPAIVVLTTKLPGNIISLNITPGKGFYVHRHGFLAGSESIDVSMTAQQKLGSGLFGGTGFFMQRLEGEGQAWLELGGEMFTYALAPGQTIRVHPGHVGAFEDTVSFNISTIPGIANKFLSGNGLWLCDLTGPGEIWLQSMDIATLAHSIEPYLSQQGGGNATAGVLGGVLGAALRS